MGACIAGIIPGSIADEIGLQPGDVLLTIDGQSPADYIAYRFAIADEVITMEVLRGEETSLFEIEKEMDEDLGIIFRGDVFDGVRACRNRCIFCFEDQMPAGMRASLRLRDDDYRLSFLHGNFLTLTNITDEDLTRIIREHLSPLFISIHATDLDIRRKLLRNSQAPDILSQIRILAEGGIEMHGQIVLCPGWNDGTVLVKTLQELAAMHPMLRSIGVVPVGLTAHRPSGAQLRPLGVEDARSALKIIEHSQAQCLVQLGTRLTFAADELYLTAGQAIPPREAYEGFPQRENGIGLARIFLDEALQCDIPAIAPAIRHATLITGTLAAPLLEIFCDRLRQAWHIDLQVLAARNAFYGGGVSVAGLLTGADIRLAVKDRQIGEMLILPAQTLNSEGYFLDDDTPQALAASLHVPICYASTVEEIIAALLSGNASVVKIT